MATVAANAGYAMFPGIRRIGWGSGPEEVRLRRSAKAIQVLVCAEQLWSVHQPEASLLQNFPYCSRNQRFAGFKAARWNLRPSLGMVTMIEDQEGGASFDVDGHSAAECHRGMIACAGRTPCELQERCLKLLADAAAEGEASPRNVAYLTDRVCVNRGRNQIYGTQFGGRGDSFAPRPIEDPEHLDKRRASVGLEPFADYEARMHEMNRRDEMAGGLTRRAQPHPSTGSTKP